MLIIRQCDRCHFLLSENRKICTTCGNNNLIEFCPLVRPPIQDIATRALHEAGAEVWQEVKETAVKTRSAAIKLLQLALDRAS